ALKLTPGPSGTTRDGKFSLVAGTGAGGYSGDGGPATAARLWRPLAAKPAPDGSVYIAESGEYSPPTATGPGVLPGATAGRRVRKVDPHGIITTYAGTGLNNNYGDFGPATNAGVRSPAGLDLGPDGSLYVSDIGSNQ